MTTKTLPSLPVTQSKPATDAPTNCAVSTGSAARRCDSCKRLKKDVEKSDAGSYCQACLQWCAEMCEGDGCHPSMND